MKFHDDDMKSLPKKDEEHDDIINIMCNNTNLP